MKKFLSLMLFFKLPDDFKGGLSDGLRMLADYIDKETGTHSSVGGMLQNERKLHLETFREFENAVSRGNLVSGYSSIQELINDKWEKLPQGIRP